MSLHQFVLSTVLLLSAGVRLSAQKPPQFSFRETVIQIGNRSLKQGDTTVVFRYQNAGDSVLVIARIVPTCTCVVPEYSTEPLQPGDSATIVAHIAPYHTGHFDQTLVIVANTRKTLSHVSIRGEITE